MPTWTALSTKSIGATITKAEVQNAMGNIEYLRERASFRVLTTGVETLVPMQYVGGAVTATSVTVDSGASDRHVEWDPETVFSGSTGTTIGVGDGRAGIWLVGAASTLNEWNFGDHSAWQLLKNSGSILAYNQTNGWYPGPLGGKSASTLSEFGAGDTFSQAWLPYEYSTVSPQARNAAVKAIDKPRPPTWWGVWVGDDTSNTDDYDGVGYTDGEDPIAWWNRLVTNLNRLYARPAAGLTQASTQTPTTNVWTNVTLGTVEFNNDDMVVTGNGKLQVNRDCWVYYSAGVMLADLERRPVSGFSGPNYFAMPEIRLVKDEGLGGEEILDSGGNVYGNYVTTTGPSEAVHDHGVYSENVIRMTSGTTLTLQFKLRDPDTLYGSPTIDNVGATHLRIFEVAADLADQAGRQYFSESRLPLNFSIDDRDETYMPRGTMKAMSRDYVNALIDPPVTVLELEENVEMPGAGGQYDNPPWQKVPFNIVEWDSQNIIGVRGTEVPSAEYELPINGLYLIVARLAFLAFPDAYDGNSTTGYDNGNAGKEGSRGIRLLHNQRVVASFLEDPRGFHEWEWIGHCSTTVVGKAGDLVTVEGASLFAYPLALAASAAIAGTTADSRVSIVWLGDGIDWERHK